MDEKKSFDEVELWRLPYGAEIRLGKKVLEENCLLDFYDEMKESYRGWTVGRDPEGDVEVFIPENMTVIQVPAGLREGKEFELTGKFSVAPVVFYQISNLVYDFTEGVTREDREKAWNKISQSYSSIDELFKKTGKFVFEEHQQIKKI